MKKSCSVVFLSFVLFLLVSCEKSLSNDREFDYQSQKQCCDASENFFKTKYHVKGSYQCHYNTKLHKCFILISLSSSDRVIGLMDVKQNKYYGIFYLNANGIQSCKVSGRKCKSEEEWNKLVRPYMTE